MRICWMLVLEEDVGTKGDEGVRVTETGGGATMEATWWVKITANN